MGNIKDHKFATTAHVEISINLPEWVANERFYEKGAESADEPNVIRSWLHKEFGDDNVVTDWNPMWTDVRPCTIKIPIIATLGPIDASKLVAAVVRKIMAYLSRFKEARNGSVKENNAEDL